MKDWIIFQIDMINMHKRFHKKGELDRIMSITDKEEMNNALQDYRKLIHKRIMESENKMLNERWG